MMAVKAATLFRGEVIPSLLMDEQLKNFGRNVVAQMAHREMSTAALAKRAGISPKTLNNVLNGRHAPQLDVLTKIAKGLKMELWQLWLPEFPADMSHDDTFPHLIETASKLTPDALKAVARMADLELQAGRRS
jgi:transcriptional regulator with XRE-family HTH domain